MGSLGCALLLVLVSSFLCRPVIVVHGSSKHAAVIVSSETSALSQVLGRAGGT